VLPTRTPSRRQAAGQEVLSELARQREVILGAQCTLDAGTADLKQGEGTLKRMGRWFGW
jgi:hypothetical protein